MNEYYKAIERLKQWDREHENAGYIISDRDKFIFPELAESEDERLRKFLIEKFSKLGEIWPEYSTKTILAWLEKQKECVPKNGKTGTQGSKYVPAEWSEEDEKKIGRLRSVVNQLASYTDSLDVNGDYCEGDYAELDTWLKSLRPSWKPTEKMLEALKWAKCEFHPDCPETMEQLKYLYTELKHLYYDRT